MNKTRFEAFSDGVIAIIITIMVLELKVPHGKTFAELRPLLPTFVCYLLSFIFIGIYWGNHHHLLHAAKKVSTGIIWSNLNLLFWLSLVPFATAWMGENEFGPQTVATYAVLLDICGISYTILKVIIEKCHEFSPAMQAALKKQSRKGIWSVIGYTLAIPAAWIHPAISIGLFFTMAIVWLVPDKNIERALSEERA